MKQRRKSERKNFIRQFEFEVIEPGKSVAVTRMARGVDISSNGLGLRTDGWLTKGMVVKLSLPAGVADAVLPVFGEIVWTESVADGIRVGMRFLM